MSKDIQYTYYYEDKFTQEDVDERRLYLSAEVDSETVDTIVYHIMRFNRLDKGIPVKERKAIKLYINSPGGSVVDGFAVIDAILNSTTPVYTINLAMSASMAFLIFIAGHKRYTLPHSEFLMHDGFTASFNSAGKVKDQIEFETVQLGHATKDYVLKQTDISEEKYAEKERIEWYMLPLEAKQYGIVDYIVGEDCDMDEII
jgi:ATP-dependent Clp protease protease subunit